MKLGGSLLDLPDLMPRLNALALMLSPANLLLVPGGGLAADCIRSLDLQFGLTPEEAHRTAIEAMRFNAELLVRLNSGFCIVADHNQAVKAWSDHRLPVLNAPAFLHHEQQQTDEGRIGSFVLPASWEVTSDSIAAWIAVRCEAESLVILKSCDPVSREIDVLIQNRMLDSFFRRVAGSFPIHWLNLRKLPLQFVALSDRVSAV